MKAPLTPPTSGASQQQFELQRVDYGAPEARGRVAGVQAGFPLWSLMLTLGNVGPTRSDAWRAFLRQLRGATRRFLWSDLGRPYPKQYLTAGFTGMVRAGGGSFNGDATSWSETLTTDGDSQVTLHGLPAGFVLGQGDYIGFRYSATEAAIAGLTWHAPVCVDTGGVADGSGNVTVTCDPPIPSAVPSGAIAYLDHPKAVMVLMTDQTHLNGIDRSLGIRGGQIAAIQDIRS